VKDTATQSGQFAACAFVLLFLAIEMFRQSRRSLAAGMLVVALIFLANILILARADLTIVPVAGLIIIPFLLILLGFKTLRAKAMFGLVGRRRDNGRRCMGFFPSTAACHGDDVGQHSTLSGKSREPGGRPAGILEEVTTLYLRCAGVGARHRFDTRALRSLRRRSNRLFGAADDRSAPADARGRDPAWSRRSRHALRDVDLAPAAVPRRAATLPIATRNRDEYPLPSIEISYCARGVFSNAISSNPPRPRASPPERSGS
jgi:hypothetical protein